MAEVFTYLSQEHSSKHTPVRAIPIPKSLKSKEEKKGSFSQIWINTIWIMLTEDLCGNGIKFTYP